MLKILSPQTWEDLTQLHAETKAKGDNDPLDVCEIGEQVGYVGQIKQVKVLGIMALLDEGETDWKVLVVDVQDPLASKLNEIEDVERHLPGLVRATNEWFRCVHTSPGSSALISTKCDTVSTKSPMASPKTSLRSPARPRTRNMLPKSSTSATRRGVASSLARALPRQRTTIFRCMSPSPVLCPSWSNPGLTHSQSQYHCREHPWSCETKRACLHAPTPRFPEAICSH